MVSKKKSSTPVTRSTRLTRSSKSSPAIPPSHASSQLATISKSNKPSLLPGTFSGGLPPDVSANSLQMASYRPAAPLPEHIREHCTIYLDEQLCKSCHTTSTTQTNNLDTSAISLLSDLVTNGQASSEREVRPIYAPPAFHIELVATLLIHPRYTNQAPPDERTQLTSQAITLLRNTLAILGPINANLQDAFSLTFDESRQARRRAHNDSQYEHSDSDSDERSERMKGIIANKGRLRRCAKDFWHVVGWAFNCSIRYPKRWKYWKVWLAYMIDVLDADWNERDRLDKENLENPDVQLKQEMNPDSRPRGRLQNCILLQYLSEVQGRSSPLARIIRSVFADASSKSLSDFPEMFKNETREVKHTGQKRKRGNRFGDYNDEDDEVEDAAETTDQQSDAFEVKDEIADDEYDQYLGGAEAMVLRQKLVTQLSRAAHFRPQDFVNTYDLYEAIYVGMKDLPVPAFSLFVASSIASPIPPEAYVSISMLYLLRLLPNNAPQPHKVQSKAVDELSGIVLEKCYLPFPASTSSIADNTRVSIQAENLLRLFLKACDWTYSASFGAAIEKGIIARESKIKSRRSKDSARRDAIDQEDMVSLRASGERLRTLSRLMEVRQCSD